MPRIPINQLRSDVLVVGGGLAALMAAIEAAKSGLKVTVVCKKKTGLSGNTLVSGAGLAFLIPGGDDSFGQYFNDTMQSGKEINERALVEVLVSQSRQAIIDLESYGVKFNRLNGEYIFKRAPGHGYARSLYCDYDPGKQTIRGLSILKPLFEQAVKLGVRVINNTAIFQLVKNDDAVRGAVGIDLANEELILFSAKAIILATGGTGRLFSQNNNTSEITGDSFNMALQAGAKLKDMEFVQFYPTMLTSPVRIPLSNTLFGDGAVLRNAAGERFMQKYAPLEMDMATRDKMCQSVFAEIEAGRSIDNQVYLDAAGISSHIIEKKHYRLKKFLNQHGIDMEKDWMLVQPAAHFFMGGLKINQFCETSLNGLYAAGECAGGVHGANRLATNALTEAAIFGTIAGRRAAGFARESRSLEMQTPVFSLPELRSGTNTLSEIRNFLCIKMWEHVSIIRSETSLLQAMDSINYCKDSLDSAGIRNFYDISGYLELVGMCNVADIIVRAALARKESRGSHFRSDFPDEDSNYLGSTEISLENDRLNICFQRDEKFIFERSRRIENISSTG